jgi:hypothetical protein
LLAFAGRESAVSVDIAVASGFVEVRISGAAPPEDVLATPTKATPSDPTGRALAVLVARAVAEAHGGHLGVDGNAYVLTLPLHEQPPGGEP